VRSGLEALHVSWQEMEGVVRKVRDTDHDIDLDASSAGKGSSRLPSYTTTSFRRAQLAARGSISVATPGPRDVQTAWHGYGSGASTDVAAPPRGRQQPRRHESEGLRLPPGYVHTGLDGDVQAAEVRSANEPSEGFANPATGQHPLELVVTICRLDKRFGFLVGSHASCRFESSGDRGQVEGIAHSE